jgi:diguanylate cyclase (GGDEF)-like protein
MGGSAPDGRGTLQTAFGPGALVLIGHDHAFWRAPAHRSVTDRGHRAHNRGVDGLRGTELRRLVDASLDAFLVLEEDAGGGLRVAELNAAAERLLGLTRGRARGMPVDDLPMAIVGGRLTDAYLAVVAGNEPLEGRVEITVPGAEGLVLRQRAVRVGRGVAITVRDLTSQREVDESLRRQLQENRRMAEEQTALRRVATAVASEDEPGGVFSLVAEEVARLLEMDAAMVCRFSAEWATVVGAYGRGGAEVGLTAPLTGEGVLATVGATGRPARVDSYRALGRALGEDAPPVPAGFRSGVGVPIRVGARVWGAILAVQLDDRPIPPDAESRLLGFGDLIGLAIANADARRRLAEEATTDSLTGLANHRAFHERLGGTVALARRHGRPLSLAVLDIDFFKRVNDEHGHQAGDRVLVEVAQRLLRQARSGELLARVGGEEFGWLLPDADGAGALAAAERARRAIAAAPFTVVGPLTISAGVAELAPGEAPGELYRRADEALYEAKTAGRDQSRLAAGG